MYIFRSERNVRSKYIDLRETLIEIHYIHTYIIYTWIYVCIYVHMNKYLMYNFVLNLYDIYESIF